ERGLPQADPGDHPPGRRSLHLRRGDHRVRPGRRLVRRQEVGSPAGHHDLRQGRHLWLRTPRRDRRRLTHRRAVLHPAGQRLPSRLHLLRPLGGLCRRSQGHGDPGAGEPDRPRRRARRGALPGVPPPRGSPGGGERPPRGRRPAGRPARHGRRRDASRAGGVRLPRRRRTHPGNGWRGAAGLAPVHHHQRAGRRDGPQVPGGSHQPVKQFPLWVDQEPRPDGLTSDLPEEADVLVVGSGFTGLSAALRLAAAGRSVVVADAGPLARGASSMNGGCVSSDVKAGVKSVFRDHGPAVAREMWETSMRALERARELAERTGSLIHDSGAVALGKGKGDLEDIRATVDWYNRELGAGWEVAGPEDIGRYVGGEAFDCAMVETDSFGVHPARLAFGLAAEVTGAGAVLVEECEVVSIRPEGGGNLGETTKGPIRAGEVILATNGYTTTRPSEKLARKIVPIGSYMIATEPVGHATAERV